MQNGSYLEITVPLHILLNRNILLFLPSMVLSLFNWQNIWCSVLSFKQHEAGDTAETTIMPPPPKKEIVFSTTPLRIQRSHRRILKFTADEDKFLKEGLDKHGFGQWTAILRDSQFKFQEGKMRDSLKKRAELKFIKKNLHAVCWNLEVVS